MHADLDALVAHGAARHAGLPAIVDRGRVVTYDALARDVGAAAAALADLGVRTGDRVLVAFENCAEAIALVFAIARLGAWPVVATSRFAPAELDAIAAHCAPRLVLFLSSASVPAAAHAARRGATTATLGTLGAQHVERSAADPAPEPAPARPGDRVAMMIYTSGTTGAPKAAMLSHANVLFIGHTQARLRGYSPEDRVYCVVPLSHAGALASIMTSVFHAGGALHLEQRFAPAELARALAEDGITALPGVPALHARMVEWAAAHPGAFRAPRLRLVTSASSPLPASVKAGAEALYGVPVHNGYGLTETTAVVAQTRLDDPRDDTTVGVPIPGVELRLAAAGAGGVGEIEVRGPNVFLGYYRDAAATRATFSDDGWFRTGDLGRRDDAGRLHVVGRSKDMIKRSGYTVYPADVEAVLDRHPAVLLCAVAGRPLATDEEIVAFAQLRDGADATPAELADWLAGALVAYRRPGVIRILPRLPTLDSGKIDRGAIRRLAGELPRD